MAASVVFAAGGDRGASSSISIPPSHSPSPTAAADPANCERPRRQGIGGRSRSTQHSHHGPDACLRADGDAPACRRLTSCAARSTSRRMAGSAAKASRRARNSASRLVQRGQPAQCAISSAPASEGRAASTRADSASSAGHGPGGNSYSWKAPVCGSKCSSKARRARARRDFTVPSAIPRTLANSP